MKSTCNVAAFGLVATGQLIMALNVLTGIFSAYSARANVSLPTLQSTFLYVALAVVYLPIKFLFQKKREIRMSLWYYLILAFVDVEGNYFAVKAFANANYVTCGLLLNLTVPFATAMCYFFLKTRYSWMHYVGSMVAIGGSIVIFATDYSSSLNGTISKELKGDFYCVIAAAFYATSNVMVQYVVKVSDMDSNIELLGFLGLFASIVSAIQIVIFELKPIQSAPFTGSVYGYFIGYVIALFTFYTIVSIFLRHGESLLFNLSLLTGPFFTFVVNYWLFDGIVKPLYWVALVLFYIGLVLYAISPPPIEPHSKEGMAKTSMVDVVEIEGGGGEEVGTKSPSTTAFASVA